MKELRSVQVGDDLLVWLPATTSRSALSGTNTTTIVTSVIVGSFRSTRWRCLTSRLF